MSRTKQLAIVKHMDQLLGSEAVMTLPTAAGPAPKLRTPLPVLEDFSNQLLMLTCIASLAGLHTAVSKCYRMSSTHGRGLGHVYSRQHQTYTSAGQARGRYTDGGPALA